AAMGGVGVGRGAVPRSAPGAMGGLLAGWAAEGVVPRVPGHARHAAATTAAAAVPTTAGAAGGPPATAVRSADAAGGRGGRGGGGAGKSPSRPITAASPIDLTSGPPGAEVTLGWGKVPDAETIPWRPRELPSARATTTALAATAPPSAIIPRRRFHSEASDPA